MPRQAYLVVGFAALASCKSVGPDTQAYSITQVIEQQESLRNSRIKVRGKLEYCQPRSCALTINAQGIDQYISIGPSVAFDAEVKRLVGRTIIVEGLLDTRCLPPPTPTETIVLCTDRPSTLASPTFVAVVR